MTYSIVARNPEDRTLAIAVASRFFAIGSVVPYVRRDVAVATQAFVNPMWGMEGVARLQAGASAQEVIGGLVARTRAKHNANAIWWTGTELDFAELWLWGIN